MQHMLRFDVESSIIRTAMKNRGGHRVEIRAAPRADETCEPAHGRSDSGTERRRIHIDQFSRMINALILGFIVSAHHDFCH